MCVCVCVLGSLKALLLVLDGGGVSSVIFWCPVVSEMYVESMNCFLGLAVKFNW